MTELKDLKEMLELKQVTIDEQIKKLNLLRYEKSALLEQIEWYKSEISRLEDKLRKEV